MKDHMQLSQPHTPVPMKHSRLIIIINNISTAPTAAATGHTATVCKRGGTKRNYINGDVSEEQCPSLKLAKENRI